MWKMDQWGHVVKAKARLVAKSYSQVGGTEYLETCISTLVTAKIRILTVFACKHEVEMYHLAAEQVFVQSDLDEEIYEVTPPMWK